MTLKLTDGSKISWKWTRRTQLQGGPTAPEAVETALRAMLGPKLLG